MYGYLFEFKWRKQTNNTLVNGPSKKKYVSPFQICNYIILNVKTKNLLTISFPHDISMHPCFAAQDSQNQHMQFQNWTIYSVQLQICKKKKN
jgi:hypothetical protein